VEAERGYSKSIQLKCLKYPPVGQPRGDLLHRRLTCHAKSAIPFRKTPLPVLITLFSLIQEYPSADRHAAHQCFSLSLAAAACTVINGVSRDATLGVCQSIPGHPARQQIQLACLAPPRLFARFNPDNAQEASARFCQNLCGWVEFSHSGHRVSPRLGANPPSPTAPPVVTY